jgi:uncharacterized protein (DUF1330 family)
VARFPLVVLGGVSDFAQTARLSTGIIVGSSHKQGRDNMKTRYTVALSMLSGIAIGAVAIQGLHAQAKPKAYTVTELQTMDATAAADVAKRIQAAQTNAGGRNFRTGGGKVVGMEGPPPPQRVAITEWDSLEKAEAFFKSKAWTDLAPDREKALKTIRRYGVEALN